MNPGSPASWLLHRLAPLDVVQIKTLDGPRGYIVRFELKDTRRLELEVEPSFAFSHDVRVVDWLEQAAVKELTKAYRCCTEHTDCADTPELGRACWQKTYGE